MHSATQPSPAYLEGPGVGSAKRIACRIGYAGPLLGRCGAGGGRGGEETYLPMHLTGVSRGA
jgi:hypothetical protein